MSLKKKKKIFKPYCHNYQFYVNFNQYIAKHFALNNLANIKSYAN